MNSEQLKAAIESGQGTTGVKASYVAANTSRTASVKWDGISLLNNFQYEENGVRAWRAFNVGPGKLFPWATFEGAAQLPEPLQVLDPSTQSTVPPENIYPFTEVLPRPIRRLTPRSRLGKDAACRNFTEVLPRFAAACNIAVSGKTR